MPVTFGPQPLNAVVSGPFSTMLEIAIVGRESSF